MSRGLSKINILSSRTTRSISHPNFQKSSRRAFHATLQPRFLDTCLGQTYNLLNGLHTITGLPWALTLPLAGLGIRILLVGPLSIMSKNAMRRRRQMLPLLHAWASHLKEDIVTKHAELGPRACHRALLIAIKRKSKEIDKRFGAQKWKGFIPLAQLPIFLLVIETIRKMSGVRDGLLGLLAKAFTGANHQDGSPGHELMQDSAVPVVTSFADEGAFWFTNLLVPDPFSALPLLLSGTMLLNIFLQWRQGHEIGKWGRRYRNAVTFLAFMVGPMTLQMPAAMHLYWLSSSTFAVGETLLVQYYKPSPRPVKPCPPPHERKMLGGPKSSKDAKSNPTQPHEKEILGRPKSLKDAKRSPTKR